MREKNRSGGAVQEAQKQKKRLKQKKQKKPEKQQRRKKKRKQQKGAQKQKKRLKQTKLIGRRGAVGVEREQSVRAVVVERDKSVGGAR